MSKTRRIPKAVIAVYTCIMIIFLAFVTTFVGVQWGYHDGKSENLIVPTKQDISMNQLRSIKKQLDNREQQITITGLTYSAQFNTVTKGINITRFPREGLSSSAWERYMVFLQVRDFYNVDMQYLKDAFAAISETKGGRSKIAVFLYFTLGKLGYNQGVIFGTTEKISSYYLAHPTIFDEDDIVCERLKHPQTWEKIIGVVTKGMK